MNNKAALRTLASLVQTQQTMERFWKDDYQKMIEAPKKFIQGKVSELQCQDNEVNEIKVLMAALEALQKNDPDSGMQQALLIAATVDLLT